MVLDAWIFIPFMMIMLLAGLQALPREVLEAAHVDGATPWQAFWEVTFPLMLPVSVTAIILRIIFKLKLADIVINVTSGGPGGATDTVTSFIYREYRDRSNVGYGTMLAMVYLVIIIVFITLLLKLASRCMPRCRLRGSSRPLPRRPQRRTCGPCRGHFAGARLCRPRPDLCRAARSGPSSACSRSTGPITTSFKTATDVTQGHLIPFVDFTPDWRGWRSLGLSPDTIGQTSTVRDEFLKRFINSVITCVGASVLAILIGSLAAYGLTRFQYKFVWMRNKDISFFFLSQLILPPVVLALPFLVLYKELGLLDTRIGLILLYTLMVLPIVIWIMRDQFNSIPIELEEAALVDGLSIWGAFFRSSCRSRCRAWSRRSSCRWCCAGTSISSPRC